MRNTLFTVVLVLLISVFVLFLSVKTLWKRLRAEKERNKENEKKISQLTKENSKLFEELSIISDNRREADEKINALHDGDSVNNAISGLCKPKGS